MSPLDDEEDGYLRYLFHTTSYAAAEQIVDEGLVPRAGAGVFRHGGYDRHSQGKIFAADGDSALEWFGKVGDQLEHYAPDDGEIDERAAAIVPVMLRIDLNQVEEAPIDDDLGSRDVRSGGSYYFTSDIEPDAVEYWHPTKKRWTPIAEGLPDARLGISEIEYYDEDGDVADEDDWDGDTPPGLTAFGPYDDGGFKPSPTENPARRRRR